MDVPRLIKRLTIGVDLDNTIVSYDSLLHTAARESGLITNEIEATKIQVRAAVRSLVNGEIHWQRLQGLVYGPKMADASLIHGVKEFFQHCKKLEIPTFVVSHKTEYAPYDESETNLRDEALAWMSTHGLLQYESTGLSEKSIHFESSRHQKLMRISELRCTHFIDDLEETFIENSFPQQVKKILFSPNNVGLSQELSGRGVTALNSWDEIKDYFFGIGS